MARPKAPASRALTASVSVEQVSGNPQRVPNALSAAASIHRQRQRVNVKTDRNLIAKPWQIECYRHVNICGEARYAVVLFSSMAGRAEIGISDGQAKSNRATWISSGPEVDVLAEIAPTVRDRTRLIRDYMMHRQIAGECYLIARQRVDTDPEYASKANVPIWEIVAVTELQKIGEVWRVRHDNGNFVDLAADDPVIRLWNPDPADRREAWSPMRALLPTLKEIEWFTKHIFTQVRSRLMSAGVWFVPNGLTFPAPPPSAVEGGEEAIAEMNEAEQFMLSLAASSMELLEGEEVSFPTVVQADAVALEAVDQDKLIKFWSEIDDKAMLLRSDAVRRFALGMDLPPEQVLGSTGLAVSGSGGSAGSVNHWGEWAKEEQTIKAHIEPALDDFVGAITSAVVRAAVPSTTKVVAYDTSGLRLRQDRSKEAIELYDRGLLKREVTLREVGFDPDYDLMSAEEHKIWLLNKIVGGSFAPDQMAEALKILSGIDLPVAESGSTTGESPKALPGRNQPRSLKDHPYEGPPRTDHEHNDTAYRAAWSARAASCEALVLRALEKAGNRLLNDGKRGKDRDRSTPAHLAHIDNAPPKTMWASDFDFTMAASLLHNHTAAGLAETTRQLGEFCAELYNMGEPYSREALLDAIGEGR